MAGEGLGREARVIIASPDGSFELRQLDAGDAEAYYELLRDSRRDENWSRKGAEVADKYLTPDEVRESIERPPDPARLRSGIWRTDEDSDRFVGSVNLSPYGGKEDATYETGSWIGAAYQGRGFVAAARNLMAAYAFDQLGARKLVSFIDADNQRSIKSVMLSGYVPTEMPGEYELTREEYEARQAV